MSTSEGLVPDATADAAALKTQAITAAQAEVTAAAGAVEKLLSTAAGDVPTLLTDAEAAAVPFVLSKVPGPFGAIVGPFIQSALAATEGSANTLANAEVAKGLAYAQAEIASVASHLSALL